MLTTRTEILAEGVTLHMGDARVILPTLARADAVVTDPPYGVNKAAWDEKYPDWLEDLAFAAARTVVIMPGMWAMPLCLKGMGDRYKAVIAGHNTNGMTFGPIGFNNWIPAVVGGDVPHRGQDAFEFAVGAEAKPDHPSPKPLAYMLKLIDRTTEPGWTIVDPFMGSGTTGVACVNMGRKFIGIEIDPAYFDIAARRIGDALKQPDFFIEKPAREKPPQLQLTTGRP